MNSKTLGARMNGAVTAPKEVSQPKHNISSQRNRYFIFDKDPNNEIDVLAVNREAAQPFYREVFRNIETASDISGLTFYLSARPPARLPRYGKDVVLLLPCG